MLLLMDMVMSGNAFTFGASVRFRTRFAVDLSNCPTLATLKPILSHFDLCRTKSTGPIVWNLVHLLWAWVLRSVSTVFIRMIDTFRVTATHVDCFFCAHCSMRSCLVTSPQSKQPCRVRQADEWISAIRPHSAHSKALLQAVSVLSAWSTHIAQGL